MSDAGVHWPALIRRAALEFGLPPHRFWALSLGEWRAMTGPTGPMPLSRVEFEAMSAAFPDARRTNLRDDEERS